MLNVYTLNGVVTGFATAHLSSAVVSSAVAGTTNYQVAEGTPVGTGWTVTIDANGNPTFAAPAAVPPTVDVPTFLSLFTIQEQMAIENSTDQTVMTAWKRFSDPRVKAINLGLGSVQNMLTYFSTTDQMPAVNPAATYIAPSRIAQILTGIPQ